MDRIKYTLSENQMPTAWYNISADLPTLRPPVLNPGTGQPIGPDDLAPLFPEELIKQEVSRERLIEIPTQVRSIYCQWRPTPLYRAGLFHSRVKRSRLKLYRSKTLNLLL